MNDVRLEGGTRLNGGAISEALNTESRNVELTESYGIEENDMEMVMEERVDVGMQEPMPDSERARNVLIRPLHNGYVVKLDCHEFAFESVERAMKYIGEYLKDPQGTEKKWWDKKLFD